MSRAFLVVLALGLATSAAAQPMATDAAPAFGTLSPGAEAASVAFDARTGTELMLDEPGCFGYADPSAPDVVVNWGGGDLRFWVRAEFDATMLVYGPDGWSCDDDSEGVLPVVSLRGAPAGRYAVWLGSFGPDPVDAAATLYAGTPPPQVVLRTRMANPAEGTVAAPGGFEARQGSLTLSVTGGGADAVDGMDLGDDEVFCAGTIDATQPTAALTYDADGGTGVLTFGAASDEADLVLVVLGPDGYVGCNDDFNGTDPFVQIDGPASGIYAVWVGTFSASAGIVDAMLTMGETASEIEIYDDFDYEPTPFSEGTYVPLDLDALPPVRIAATDADGGSAEVSVRPMAPNPVQGMQCSGYLETSPSAGLTLDGDGPFALTATSDSDLTLLVRTPSGGWFCSDDADGLDPGIQIDAPEAGLYLAWVGSFGDFGEEAAVDATVSAMPGEIVVTAGGYEGGYEGMTQSDGEYDGSDIVGGSGGVALTAGAPQTVEVSAGGDVLNPVVGDACYGFLGRTPSATVEADGMLTASASADTDLTMVVQAPDGTWACSDDADGSDPAVTVDGGPGTYSIWIGTYSRRTEAVSADLRIE